MKTIATDIAGRTIPQIMGDVDNNFTEAVNEIDSPKLYRDINTLGNFEQGGLNDSGDEVVSTSRNRSAFIPIEDVVKFTITPDVGFRFIVYYFESSENYLSNTGWLTDETEFIVDYSTYQLIRVMVGRIDSSDTTPIEAKANISILFTNTLADTVVKNVLRLDRFEPYNLFQLQQLEQGTIAGGIDTDSDTRIRTGYYIDLRIGYELVINDPNKEMAILLFNSDKSSYYDTGWVRRYYLNENDYRFVRIIVRNRDNSNIIPGDLDMSDLYVSRAEYRHVDKACSVRPNGTVVNDAMNQTSASAAHLAVNENGIACTSYCAGYGSYGEAQGHVVISVFPVVAPHLAQTYKVAENGYDLAGGGTISGSPFESNCILLDDDDTIRILFNNGTTNYYRDFSLSSLTFLGDIYEISFNGEAMNITNVAAYASGEGYAWSNQSNGVINTCRIINIGGTLYTCLTSTGAYPIVCSSADDGASWMPQGIIPIEAAYECQIEYLSNTYYFLLRTTGGIYLITSTDLSTFNSELLQNTVTTRPMIVSDGANIYLFITHSQFDSGVQGGRTSCHIYMGTGYNYYNYTLQKTYYDEDGIVYYAPIYKNSKWIMVYSTEQFNLALTSGAAKQGKDTVNFMFIDI